MKKAASTEEEKAGKGSVKIKYQGRGFLDGVVDAKNRERKSSG